MPLTGTAHFRRYVKQMENFRISKTVEKYKENLIKFADLLRALPAVDVRISGTEYSSFIYAKGSVNSVEVMEADCGVWVEYFQLDVDDAVSESAFFSYEEAFGSISDWLRNT